VDVGLPFLAQARLGKALVVAERGRTEAEVAGEGLHRELVAAYRRPTAPRWVPDRLGSIESPSSAVEVGAERPQPRHDVGRPPAGGECLGATAGHVDSVRRGPRRSTQSTITPSTASTALP
jgi:hypothetical protein